MSTEDAASRTEAEIVSGILEVTLGKGIRKQLRVLTMAESRPWKLELVNVGGKGLASMDLQGADDVSALVDTAADKILELVVRYDVDGSLGGREWLEANATDAQIYAIFRRCLEVSFPFVRDLRSALAEIRAIGLADLLSSGVSRSESSGSTDSGGGASASTEALLTSS